MAHPYHHALSSVRKWGGKVEDYLPIHNWFDESKAFLADFLHRALRHHAEGIFLCEKIFGESITTSEGKVVPVRWTDGIIKTNQTRKHHERAIKVFTRWAHATERLDRDILARLDVTYVDQERNVVHTRSEFTRDEMSRIIRVATGATPLAGLTGRQRALLYAFAASTGFRARECAAIRRQDFTEDFAFVTLSGLFTKNRKRATLPIPPSLREVLAEYAAKLAPDALLWPGGWEQNQKKEWVPAGWIKDSRAGEFLRADAALVGIVIGRKGKESNGGRVLDFHSFRHTYISNLERADVTDGLRGQLSRATAQVVERYTHRELGRLSEVAERLPTPDLSALKRPA